MAITLRFESFSAECGTVEEAAAFIRQIGVPLISGSRVPVAEVDNPTTPPTHSPSVVVTSRQTQQVAAVLTAMADGPEGGSPAGVIGKAFGLDGTDGLGPKARVMARVLARFGLDIEQVREIKVSRTGNRWRRGPDFQKALDMFESAAGVVEEFREVRNRLHHRSTEQDTSTEHVPDAVTRAFPNLTGDGGGQFG